jgi:O-antigen/teichoic acid export membrane protein
MTVAGISVTLFAGLMGRQAFLGGAPQSVVIIAALSIPGLLATQIAGYVLLMLGRIRTYALAALAAAIGQLTVVLAIVAEARLSLQSAAFATTAGFLVSGLLMTGALARQLGARAMLPKRNKHLLRELIRVGAGIHPMSVAIQLGPRVDLLVVGALASTRSTGLYSLALTVAQMPLFASWTLAQAGVGPITERSEREAVEYGCEFTRQTALVGIALAAVGSAFAYPLVQIAYGTAWLGTVIPLVILLAGTVSLGIENPLRVLLLRVATPLHMAAVASGSVLLNGLLTVIFIVPFGIVGAACASFIAYWALGLGMIWLLTRAVDDVPIRRSLRGVSRGDWLIGVGFAQTRRIGVGLASILRRDHGTA